MDYQPNRNCLKNIENMGFKVTWKLITVGLSFNNDFQLFLSYDEIFDYFNYCLGRKEEHIDKIVSILCEKGDTQVVARLLADFSENDRACEFIQIRKWKAYTLKTILEKKYCDYLQGILELLEFWSIYDYPQKCPINFPTNRDKEYFTETKYEELIKQSSKWLKDEIQNITHLECNIISL